MSPVRSNHGVSFQHFYQLLVIRKPSNWVHAKPSFFTACRSFRVIFLSPTFISSYITNCLALYWFMWYYYHLYPLPPRSPSLQLWLYPDRPRLQLGVACWGWTSGRVEHHQFHHEQRNGRWTFGLCWYGQWGYSLEVRCVVFVMDSFCCFFLVQSLQGIVT